jgi:hypothetical protein
MKKTAVLSALPVALVVMTASGATAQITAGDYQRAQSLRQQYESAAVLVPETPEVGGDDAPLLLPAVCRDGFEWVMVDADTQRKERAFDHTRVAEPCRARRAARIRPRACPSTTSPSTTR